jgi:hypothetical protein
MSALRLAATRPPRRRAWLRTFVVRCSLPCDPPVGGHSCNGGMISRLHRRERPIGKSYKPAFRRSLRHPPAPAAARRLPTWGPSQDGGASLVNGGQIGRASGDFCLSSIWDPNPRLGPALPSDSQCKLPITRPGIGAGWQSESVRTDIKVLYCFHQNIDDSKCEAVHTSTPDSALTIRPSEFGVLAGGVDARRDHQ